MTFPLLHDFAMQNCGGGTRDSCEHKKGCKRCVYSPLAQANIWCLWRNCSVVDTDIVDSSFTKIIIMELNMLGTQKRAYIELI